MARNPELLDQVLAKQPAAVMLSFGELEPHASRIKARGVPLICQVQGMSTCAKPSMRAPISSSPKDARPEVTAATAAYSRLSPKPPTIWRNAPPIPFWLRQAAVGDGRGLAAALMLGADGVLVGTRFIASPESEAPEGFRQAIIRADGDSNDEIDLGRYRPKALLAQSGIRNSRSQEQLRCQVARARAREMEKAIDVEYERFWAAQGRRRR